MAPRIVSAIAQYSPMLGSAQSLPDDPVVLQGIITQLTEQLVAAQRARAEQAQRIDQLREAIALLRRKRFGAGADHLRGSRLALFDEAELETLIGESGVVSPGCATAARG